MSEPLVNCRSPTPVNRERLDVGPRQDGPTRSWETGASWFISVNLAVPSCRISPGFTRTPRRWLKINSPSRSRFLRRSFRRSREYPDHVRTIHRRGSILPACTRRPVRLRPRRDLVERLVEMVHRGGASARLASQSVFKGIVSSGGGSRRHRAGVVSPCFATPRRAPD